MGVVFNLSWKNQKEERFLIENSGLQYDLYNDQGTLLEKKNVGHLKKILQLLIGSFGPQKTQEQSNTLNRVLFRLDH